MVDPKIIKEWFDKAEEDFLYASMSLENDLPFFSQICFHYQQAAEKYFKTYIVANELRFEKIHDLIELLNICKECDKSFSGLEEDCVMLNKYYISTRYPEHWPTNYNQKNAEEAKQAAQKIRDFVKVILGLQESGS